MKGKLANGVGSPLLLLLLLLLFTAIGLLPGGSGYFTCKQNLKLVTTKFKSGGPHEKNVVFFTLPRNMVYPALLPLMRTPRAASSRLN